MWKRRKKSKPMTHPVAPVSTSPTRSIALHRIIVALYAILSLAGLGRSSFQVLTKFDQAPLAYSLSSFAALMYVLATLAIALSARKGARGVAMVALGIELVGVVGVGAASLVRPELFPDATIWSQFGAGYAFIPLVLPVVGLWWLVRPKVSS
jgi:hypothetical protein